MPGIPLFHRIESDTVFVLLCDLVVFCNLVYIGVEVDVGHQENLAEPFFWCRVGFLIWCGIEFAIRILGAGTDFVNLRNCCEMIFVTCAALDVVLFDKPGWLWRFSGLRSWRMLRVYQFARTSQRLKELSLVLDSMIRSSKALLYLAAVMGGVYWSSGAWARGILNANGTLDSLDQEWVEEFWGQSLKAAFTMFQLSTNDGWAASVRPILDLDVAGGLLLLLYTWVTSYTLLSLGIGVMVWATVEEARSGGDHGAHVRQLEDREAMAEIRKHFEQSLQMQDRAFIDYQELRDALTVPEIIAAILHLELPVHDALTLFEHVDVMQTGRIKLEDLMDTIKSLTSKATPFDTCCLTARIGGTATFTTRLVTRTELLAENLQEVRRKLELGIEELTRASIEDEELTSVPEVSLRKSGHINHYKVCGALSFRADKRSPRILASCDCLGSRIMREVRRAVMNATSGNAKGAAGGTLLWLSRLQVIDEQALGRSTLALLEALQQLRFLSSEARLPELRKSCQQSLQQICALTASPEFRSRCLEVPPETTLPALEIFAGEEEEAETEPLEEAEAPALLETAPAPSAGAAGPASPASPLPEPKPEAEREAPEARAEVRLGKECDQEEQDRFYELLLAAVLPLLGDGSCLASEEVLFMLGRAGLQAQAQDLMRGKERVEGEELRRILETA
ncbi:unnamed protein product, partial [Effrenium voratum]